MSYKSVSTRHQKIAGDFGEILILYMLSKYGFESAWVDHTGIDILAYNEETGHRIGVSTKTRTRSEDHPDDAVGVRGDEYKKMVKACKSFNADPWISFVVDKPKENGGEIFCYLLSLETLRQYYPNFLKGKGFSWTTNQKSIKKYSADKNIFSVQISYNKDRWIK